MSNQLQTNLDTILQDKNTNLLPENLKAGVTCLGVEGTMTEGIDTSDATATATDIVKDKTAYVNGEKITGTLESQGIQITDYFNTTPEEGQKLIKAYPETIDCSKLLTLDFHNDFEGVYISNLINTENVSLISSIAHTGTLGFKQTELDVSSVSSFTNIFSSFTYISSIPKLKNLFKNLVGYIDFTGFCNNCGNLETIPPFEIACEPSTLNGIQVNVTNMITLCPKLSEQSITNVLNFLKLLNDNSVMFDVHTLSDVGLSYTQLTNLTSAQLEIVNSMSGWTTGLELYNTQIEVGELKANLGSSTVSLNDMTLQEYLDIVDSKLSVSKWSAEVWVDYNLENTYEFNSPTELITGLNNLKFKSSSDTMTISVMLMADLETGEYITLTHSYDNTIPTNTKTNITVLMQYVPIKINIDTKNKDLTEWTITLGQVDTTQIGVMGYVNDITGTNSVPINANFVLTNSLTNYSTYQFLMAVFTPENLDSSVRFVCDTFNEDNLTVDFVIEGTVLEDKSEENNKVSNVMTLYSNSDDDYTQGTLYYKNPDDTVIYDNIELYSNDDQVFYVGDAYSTSITDRVLSISVTSENKTIADINGYKLIGQEIDVSL